MINYLFGCQAQNLCLIFIFILAHVYINLLFLIIGFSIIHQRIMDTDFNLEDIFPVGVIFLKNSSCHETI
jgi:hypothetical protein